MQIFANRRKRILAMKAVREQYIPQERRVTCPGCQAEIDREKVDLNNHTCTECGYYWPVPAYERIQQIADEGTFRETDKRIGPKNPLDFPGYDEKLKAAANASGLREGVVTGTCKLDGRDIVIGVMDSRFMMGSMSSAVGEKITRAIELAVKRKCPLIMFAASGGARMQEGIISLMQMAKTSAALTKMDEKGLLYISVLTNPTTGGVTASFASLGDIVLAERGALIGFAGPRVIEQTIGEKLPEGFQRAEFQMEHGFADQIVERKELRGTLSKLLKLHS